MSLEYKVTAGGTSLAHVTFDLLDQWCMKSCTCCYQSNKSNRVGGVLSADSLPVSTAVMVTLREQQDGADFTLHPLLILSSHKIVVFCKLW